METTKSADAGSKNWLKERGETVDEDDEAVDEVPETTVKKNEAEDEDLEDIDAIVNVPPPEEIVVKIAQKPAEEDTIASNHGKETSEDVYRSFAESILEQGLTTKSELELSFDLKPEDIKIKEEEETQEDLNEADITEEKVQEKLKDADVDINHNEENKGDVKDQEDDKSEESTLTKEVDVDTVPKNND